MIRLLAISTLLSLPCYPQVVSYDFFTEVFQAPVCAPCDPFGLAASLYPTNPGYALAGAPMAVQGCSDNGVHIGSMAFQVVSFYPVLISLFEVVGEGEFVLSSDHGEVPFLLDGVASFSVQGSGVVQQVMVGGGVTSVGELTGNTGQFNSRFVNVLGQDVGDAYGPRSSFQVLATSGSGLSTTIAIATNLRP